MENSTIKLHSESKYFSHSLVFNSTDRLILTDTFTICMNLENDCHIRHGEDDYHIKENEIYFFPPNTLYTLETRGKNIKYYELNISDEYLNLFFRQSFSASYSSYYITRSDDSDFYDQLCNYIASVMFNSLSDKKLTSFLQITDINRILISIMDKYYLQNESSTNWSTDTTFRIQKIIQIISEHYTEKLRLEDISSMIGLNPQYFSTFFTANFHEKYTDYLNRYRVNQSLRALLTSDQSLLDIALNHGFQSSKSYCNSFKKYFNELPSTYRRTHAEQNNGDAAYVYASLIHHASYLYENYWQKNPIVQSKRIDGPQNKAPYTPLSLELSLENPKVLFTDERIRSLSIGSFTYLLQDEIYSQLQNLKQHFHFSHIHIRDIFSDYCQIYTETLPGKIVYYWGDMDRALNRIVDLGFIPFIEIGYMPIDLSSTDDRLSYSNHPHVGPPKDMKNWRSLIRHFLNHCLDVFGDSVFEWKFDFWNTANLNTHNGYWTSTQEEFFQLYKATWETFQSVDKKLLIGTPSFSLPDGITWYEDFFEFCTKNNIKLSHFGFHMYSCMDNLKTYDGLFPFPATTLNYLSLTTKNYTNNLIYFIRQILNKHNMKDLPIIASEWNITYYLSDLIRDTAFMFPYIAHNYIQTMDKISGIGYFCLSDINDQYRPSEIMFSGATGIYTPQGIPKPAALIFSLLHKLDSNIVARDNNYVVTYSKNSIHCLVYNMAEYEKATELDSPNSISPEHRYQVFSDTPPIHFKGILHVKPGDYAIKTYVLDRNHGSYYDHWIAMGRPERLSSEMTDILKRDAHPALRYEVQNDTSSIMLDEIIKPHGVTLFEIKRL